MTNLDLAGKLAILADAAKYDASCSSSAAPKRTSAGGRGVGSTEGSGICHAYAPDGRCISLLKILLTNYCKYDCAYCVNRISSDVRRARFTAAEVVGLTLDFYKRNYIEGLFLSSGIIRSSDYTMEQIVEVARSLREDHDFRGYIHLKTIPEADPLLLEKAGRYADRLSINVELPSEQSLGQLAPEKDLGGIKRAMGRLRLKIEEAKDERKASAAPPPFAGAGQSTQMIVGADPSSDLDILSTSTSLYASYRLKRVYYSAFSPIPRASAALPLVRPPLMREHRLYQADWLLRFYGFSTGEIATGMRGGMLDLKIDPKFAWALENRHGFPVDVNRAAKEQLLRVPGLGTRAVKRILQSRRHRRLRLEDVGRITASIARVRPFIVAEDWHPGTLLDAADLRAKLVTPPRQLDLFTEQAA
ncbi:putative DNA modification/repair radical SAM protein [Microbaculum marinum]|uniref:DNA modification/repair radical SAM protein n=1 Tax=Microbaculum marinum TaxID=1764581 RepID=A0AAW9RW09_9HYPH